MKKIEDKHYEYKKFDIFEAKHPKLFGKYEIFKNDDFIARVDNLKNAKKTINTNK